MIVEEVSAYEVLITSEFVLVLKLLNLINNVCRLQQPDPKE